MKRRQRVESGEDDAHGMRVVRQSLDGGDDRDGQRGVAHDGLLPLAELSRVGEVAVHERERGLRGETGFRREECESARVGCRLFVFRGERMYGWLGVRSARLTSR